MTEKNYSGYYRYKLNPIFKTSNNVIRKAKDIWKQDPEANIWAQEKWDGQCKRLQNEELHSYIVRVIKSRRLWLVEHEARMEEGRSAFEILTDVSIWKWPLGSLGLDGRTLLRWMLEI